MILRSLVARTIPVQGGFRPAWPAFLDSQWVMDPPYAIILQPEHSQLAGQIASQLDPDVFGELSEEVITAIREHDQGWKDRDEADLAKGTQIPFPLLPPEQYLPVWKKCVEMAAAKSDHQGCLTSRHFSALAKDDPTHATFVKAEAAWREKVEARLGMRSETLRQATAALGFCDLVSLVLCSGATERVAFPLAHPAMPDAHKANKVLLEWKDGNPRFSRRVVCEGTTVSLDCRQRSDKGLQPVRLTWTFLD